MNPKKMATAPTSGTFAFIVVLCAARHARSHSGVKGSCCELRSLALINMSFEVGVRTRLMALPREGNEHEAYEIAEDGFCRRPVKKCVDSSRGTGAHETREYARSKWHFHIDHSGLAHRTHSYLKLLGE